MLVNEFLEQSAEKFPDKTALICEGQRLTFLELEGASNSLAHGFRAHGLGRQDRVAIFLEPCAEAVSAIFAALKAGGVFTVINPQVKARKIEYILNDCRAKILFTDSIHLAGMAAVLPSLSNLKLVIITDHEYIKREIFPPLGPKVVSYAEILGAYPSVRPARMSIDIDLASLIYTSGSTGIPKGVMLTHLNMVAAAESIIQYLENTADDIILDALPLSFDYGLYQVLMAFKFGGTIILEMSFLYPYKTIELMIKEKVTGFPIVPTMAAVLFGLKKLEEYDFSSLRYITNTGQSLPVQYIGKLQKLFPRAKIYSMYGLTECKRVSYLPPEEIQKRPASVGKAMPNTEAYIVDENGRRVAEPGVTGELVVRGSHVMKGYWNLPEETEKVLKPGPLPDEKVLYTGDLFRMDEEGFLYFVARKDDMIKVAGGRVSPKEIENVLYERPEIDEAAVIGVNHEILGQAVKAFVVLKAGCSLTTEDILKHCASQLENFMVPKFIEFRERLPRSSHGKIDKKELK